MNKKKIITRVLLGVLAMGLLLVSDELYREYVLKRQKTITVGFFSNSYWGVQNGYSYQILNDAIARFRQKYPDINVEYESGVMKEDYSDWLSQKLLEGKAPDVFLVLPEDFNDLVEIGALRSLDHYQIMDESFSADAFYSAAYEYGQYHDRQWALPYECASTLMFVNKTILDENNIPLPEEDWTWDDFYEISKACTKDTNGDGVTDIFGYYGYEWEYAFSSNHVQLFSEDGRKVFLGGENVEEAMGFLEKLKELSEGRRSTEKDFDLGTVVFQPMSFSQFKAYKPYPLSVKKYSGFEWGCLPMPAGPHGSNVSYLDTLMIGMNDKCMNKQMAWEFMKQLSYDEKIQNEIYQYSDGMSVLKNVTKSSEILKTLFDDNGISVDVLSNAVENAEKLPRFRNYNNALNAVDAAIAQILNSNQNISTNLIIHNRELNRELSAN